METKEIDLLVKTNTSAVIKNANECKFVFCRSRSNPKNSSGYVN